METVCILGPGAVGLLYAICLGEHADTYLAGRSHVPVETLSVCGALERSLEPEFFHPILSSQLDSVPRPAIFIVCVKVYDLKPVLDALVPALRSGDAVALSQNGLEVAEFAKSVLPGFPLVRLLLRSGITHETEARIRLAGGLNLTIAADPEHGVEADRIASVFRKGGFEVLRSDDVKAEEWRKVLLNVAVNLVCTLAGARNGELLASERLREVGLRVIREAKQVALKDGVLIPMDDEQILEQVSHSASNWNSTLCDLRKGSRTEAAFIFDPVLRLADKHGVDVPTILALRSILSHLERSGGDRLRKAL